MAPAAWPPLSLTPLNANKPAQFVLRDYYLTLPGDFDNDRDVDLSDLVFFAKHWQATGVIGGPDLNLDGRVAQEDLVILSHNWLQTMD